MLIAFRMVKSGYASSYKEATQLSARVVIQALSYESFLADYEAASIELNKGD